MEHFLKLRRFNKKIHVEINKTGLFIIDKSLTNYHEYQIDFDHLDTKKIIKSELNDGLLFFVFAFSIITVIKLIILLVDSKGGLGTGIFFFLSLSFLILAILTKKQTVIILKMYEQGGLELPFNDSNEKEVREFADLIILQTKEFLIAKYAKVDKDLPRENQFEKIISLKERDIISDIEFERLKNILIDKETDKK